VSLAPAAAALLAVTLAVLASGCQSTQEKSAELEKKGGRSFQEEGIDVKKASKDVKVVASGVLSDENGAAAIAVLRNKTKRPLVKVPVSIDVLGPKRKGKPAFSNTDPGLDPSLTGFGLIKPGQTVFWVHDQILATGKFGGVKVKPGQAAAKAPAKLPEIEVGPAKLVNDATSGIAAEGKVTNKSDLLQRKLVIYGVARKGDQIVAGGRGLVEKLNPGKSARYQIFFIGNPRGARIELAAPPTALE